MEQSDAQPSLGNTGNPSLWIDTHLLEMKTQDYYGFKRWTSAKSIQGVFTLKQRPRPPTKISFKGGSHLSNPNPSTFLASSNLGDEISFKGGSL
jgi:hypothetical protein